MFPSFADDLQLNVTASERKNVYRELAPLRIQATREQTRRMQS